MRTQSGGGRGDLAAALTAASGIVLVISGVPLALLQIVGPPVVRQPPSIDVVVAAARYGQIAPSTLLHGLALVLWLTWALVVITLLAETAAVVRGTVARALPGLATLQQVAGRAVATAMLLSSAATRAAAQPPPIPPPPSTPAATAVIAATAPPTTAPEPARPVWTVQRHDSLWSIAEATLGDGRRWKEIAARNVGRGQPDGGRLRANDTLIRPGWRLQLPPDATIAAPAMVPVRVGDDLWSLAEQHLGDGGRWTEIYARNRARPQPDGGRLTDPDLIEPGWTLRLPDATRPPAKRGTGPDHPDGHGRRRQPHAATDTPRTPRSRDDDVSTSAAVQDRDVGRDHASRDSSAKMNGRAGDEMPAAPLPVTPSTLAPDVRAAPANGDIPPGQPATSMRAPALPANRVEVDEKARDTTIPAAAAAAGALLSAGLVVLIARRRRHWLRRREPGVVPDPVDAEAEELERWLRSMADHDLRQRVDRALRAMTDLFGEHGVAPEIEAVELGERIAVRLRVADAATPPGVTVADDGRRWILPPEFAMAPPQAVRRYVPAMVSAGRLPSGALLLVNPLGGPGLGVRGPDNQVADVLTSWTAELASGGAEAGVELVVAGPHHPLVERLARVTIATDTVGATARVRRLLERADHRPAGIIVIHGSAAADANLDALLTMVPHPRVGLVLSDCPRAPHGVEVAGDRVRLRPDGPWLDAPEWLTPDDWDRFGDILSHTGRATATDPLTAPLQAAADLDVDAQVRGEPLQDDSRGHVVGLLGPLTVDGCASTLTDDAAAVLSWLAVHRTGTDPASLRRLLWPTSAPDTPRLGHAVAEIEATVIGGAHADTPPGEAHATGAHDDPLGQHERAVDAQADDVAADPGAAADGLIVVTTDDGRLELCDLVVADVAHFHELVESLDRFAPPEQARRMYAALALVRGEPFASGAAWAHADGMALRTAALVVDVAHRLAMQSLVVGDTERATWAVDRGLTAAPTAELLHRDRMRICEACGDGPALEACMRHLRKIVDADGGWVTPETEQLYARLSSTHGEDNGVARDAS